MRRLRNLPLFEPTITQRIKRAPPGVNGNWRLTFAFENGDAILVDYHQLSNPVDVPSLALGYIWFANGIIGAVMAGWMICIILLAMGPFLEGQLHAWNTIAIPLASWFLIDTAFSIAHGVWGNVLLNTATGLMFGIPLLFSRRHFIAKH